MLPIIESLLILQDRDRSLIEMRADLARIPAELAHAKKRLQGADSGMKAAKEAMDQNSLATRQIEMDVKTRRETIARLHTQRFETRKNEEFTAFGHEIENYEKQISDLEDREIELMEEAETLRATAEKARMDFESTKKAVEEEVAAYAKREEHEQQQIEETEAERAEIAAKIDDQKVLAQYDRLLPKKFPVVVGVMHGDTCDGCHMKLTSGTLNAVKTNKSIAICDHCGRMVYKD